MNSMRTPADRPLSLIEYSRLPEENGARTELVRGWLVHEPAPAPLHGSVQVAVIYRLRKYAEEYGNAGFFTGPTNFVLAEDPPTVRIPDVAYVSKDRIPPDGYARSMWHVAPDLAVEITSPSNTWSAIQEKVSDYFGAGSRLVWVIDPPSRTVTVYRPGAAAERLTANDELQESDVLPQRGSGWRSSSRSRTPISARTSARARREAGV